MSIESIESKTSKALTVPQKRVIWLQNSADHYFVQMLDALNAQGDVEYFGVFLCPPPSGNVLHQLPKMSPHVFLGTSSGTGSAPAHTRLGAPARQYIQNLDFSAAIVGVGGTFGIMGLCWRCGMGSGNWCLSRDRFVASRPFCKKVVHFYFVRLSRTARGIIWDNRRYSVCISEMCGRGVLVFGAGGCPQ